jgi:hypothetical protein
MVIEQIAPMIVICQLSAAFFHVDPSKLLVHLGMLVT